MRTLIVDDIPENLSILEYYLSSAKYPSVKASNGKEALKILEKDANFQIIISDILMPEMDGFAFLRRVKQNERFKKIPFVFYTASCTSEKDKEFALSLGAALFLIKPEDDEHFLTLIDEVIKANLKGELLTRDVQIKGEEEFLKLYSEALIRKLEDKMISLEKERNTLALMLNVVSDCFVIMDSSHIIQSVSSSIKDFLGYGASELIGKKCSDFIYLAAEDKSLCENCPLENENEFFKFEEKRIILKCKDGKSIPCIVRFGVGKTGLKGNVHYIYSFKDLTKEETYSAIIEKKNIKLELLNDLAKIISYSLDIKDVYKTFAAKLETIIHYERASIAILNNGSLEVYVVAEKGEHRAKEGFKLPLDGTVAGYVIKNKEPIIINDIEKERVKDKFPLSPILHENIKSYISVPLIIDDECIGTFNLGVNYTDAFNKENLFILNSVASFIVSALRNSFLYQKIAESEKSYRFLFEESSDVLFTLDEGLRFTNINKAGSLITGYNKDELIGKSVYDLLDEEYRKIIISKFQSALKGGEIDESLFEVDIINKEGNILTCEIKARLGKDKEGNLQIHGTARDITEFKKLKQQVVQMDKMSAVGSLVAGIAHELNNPLTGVIGYSEILLFNKDITGKRREQIETIASEAERARKIVQNLLAFAREHKPEKKVVNINEVIEKTIGLREYDLKVNNIYIQKRLSDDIPLTMADPHHIQQVMINLLVNSEQAILEKKSRSGHIFVETSFNEKNKRIKIEVSDDGVGIPKSIVKRIFDPFFTTKKVGKGTGLGLSILFGIITEHKGLIYVDEKHEKGAKFIIELPAVEIDLKEADKKVVEDKGVPPYEKKITGRILVVDDEEVILSLLSEVIGSFGFEVDTSITAKTALEKVNEKGYDLIISDFKMPEMSGDRLFAEIIKTNPSYRGKIVFITGDILNPETQRFLKETGSLCLPKPFKIEEIKEFISLL